MIVGHIAKRYELTASETDTFRRLLLAAVFQGMMQAVWIVMPEVIRNTLQAEKIYIVLITLMWPVGQLFATYWSAYLDGKPDKSRVLVACGLFGRLPLVFGALFSDVLPLLFFFVFIVISNPAVLGAQHAIVQTNLRKEIRGKIYSYQISMMTLASLVTVLLFGIWLDANPQNYRWIIMIASVAGLLEALVLSRIELQITLDAVYAKLKQQKRSLSDAIVLPWRQLIRLFREDRAFFRYEMNFFVYGLGFMILQPFITFFLVNDLALSYTQISLAKGTILQTGLILMAPVTGRVFDRKNPILFAAFIFLMIAFFPMLLITTAIIEPADPQWMIYLSFGVQSIGWSGVVLVWNLGSMFFAQTRDVSRYTGAHVVMVGLRGALAMLIAVFLVEYITPVMAFAATAVLWLSASLLMFWQWVTRYRDSETPPPERPAPVGPRHPPVGRSGV